MVPSDRTDVWRAFEATWPGARHPPALRIFSERAASGDHFWVYGNNQYYVCRVDGGWQYREGGEWDRHDIHNILQATWQKVPQDLVPGIVRRSMTMLGTAKMITSDPDWRRYSQRVFEEGEDLLAQLDGSYGEALAIQLSEREPHEVFQVLDEDETEDVVGLYLQEQDWRMIKSSAYRSQRDVECIMRRVVGGKSETCAYQVKSGETITINSEDYAHLKDLGSIFVFSTAPLPYTGTADQVIPLKQADIRDFLVEHVGLLLPATQLKLALWAGIL